MAASFVASLLFWPLYPEGDPVALVGIFSMLMALSAGLIVNPYYPALPQFAAGLFAIQHVFCPMIYYANPELIQSSFDLTPSFMESFRLSCWASAILTGTILTLTIPGTIRGGTHPAEVNLSPSSKRAITRWCWYTWCITTLLSLVMRRIPFLMLAYIWTLFLTLQMVSMCGLILLLPRKKCTRYVILVLAAHTVAALTSGMFSRVAIATGVAILFLAHRRHWRGKLAVIILAGALVGTAIQAEKAMYREKIWGRSSELSTLTERLQYWGGRLSDRMTLFLPGIKLEHVWPLVARLNQGRIVERIVHTVPEYEPYAGGETIVMAVKLVVPRVLWQEKPIYYSLEMFQRYTQHELQSHTSMGVGPLGECYLNFGAVGGLAAFAVYSLSIALISRYWVKVGAAYPLWWCWYYYIMSYWLRFESDFAKSLNATVKSAFVFVVFVTLSGVWRQALGLTRKKSRPVPQPQREDQDAVPAAHASPPRAQASS